MGKLYYKNSRVFYSFSILHSTESIIPVFIIYTELTPRAINPFFISCNNL